MNKAKGSNFVYVIYIRTTPEQLWSALTSEDFMKQYWMGRDFRTTWQVGASWELFSPDGQVTDSGEIIELDPPKRIVLKWRHEFRPELKIEGYGQCVMELEQVSDAVKLSVTHSIEYDESKLIQAVSGGWPRILSNLKSLLETGRVVLTS